MLRAVPVLAAGIFELRVGHSVVVVHVNLARAERHFFVALAACVSECIGGRRCVEKDRDRTIRWGRLERIRRGICASSALVRTATPTGLPAYALRQRSSRLFTDASASLLSNTTLPLAIYVRTFVKPTDSHILHNSAIGSVAVAADIHGAQKSDISGHQFVSVLLSVATECFYHERSGSHDHQQTRADDCEPNASHDKRTTRREALERDRHSNARPSPEDPSRRSRRVPP